MFSISHRIVGTTCQSLRPPRILPAGKWLRVYSNTMAAQSEWLTLAMQKAAETFGVKRFDRCSIDIATKFKMGGGGGAWQLVCCRSSILSMCSMAAY